MAECHSLPLNALRLGHKLAVNSLAGAMLDSIVSVESPQSMSRNLAACCLLEQRSSLSEGVRVPSLQQILFEQYNLYPLRYDGIGSRPLAVDLLQLEPTILKLFKYANHGG